MAERTYSKGKKSVSDSLTESIKSVRYEDINGVNRLFGGRLMEWIDETAGIAARRHCGGDVTTACVDQLTFKHPAFLNDVVVIVAAVTYGLSLETDEERRENQDALERIIFRKTRAAEGF